MRLIAVSALLLTFGLACSGGTEAPVPPPVEAPPAVVATTWAYSTENGQELVKAGATQSLAVGTELVLLGPALAGTENRQIVGATRVAEVWPDLSRVQTERLRKDAPPPEVARLATPEDRATIDALPKFTPGKAARPAGAPVAGSGPGGAADVKTDAEDTFSREDLPADLREGTPDAREEALSRYESDASMTRAIVFVMKHDPSEEVRFKAWRVVRARWNKRIGNPGEHEAAAGWLAGHGADNARCEALAEIADLGRSMAVPVKYVGDPSESVRAAAAKAVYDLGVRLGKRADAKEILKERRNLESSGSLRKKLQGWIDDL